VLLAESKKDESAVETVFQQWDGSASDDDTGDEKRLQLQLHARLEEPLDYMVEIANHVRGWIRHELEWRGALMNEAYAMISKAGCAEQCPHIDANVTVKNPIAKVMAQKSCFSLSVIVALQPDTRIVLWPASHSAVATLLKIQSKKYCAGIKQPAPIVAQEINLDVGAALVFRQDLVHAGAAYRRQNLRFHMYIDNKNAKRMDDVTRLLNDTEANFFHRE
jgi:ectoine hydroxylase-related dioxygenase (phytanoyl-CoA dioxygenase family)